MLGADVSECILCIKVDDADYTLLNQLLGKNTLQRHVFIRELRVRFPATCRAAVLSMNPGMLSKSVPNPSFFVVFDQTTDFVIVRTAATSSASVMNCAVTPATPL